MQLLHLERKVYLDCNNTTKTLSVQTNNFIDKDLYNVTLTLSFTSPDNREEIN